ncbi:MAG: hypothetical protein JWO57_1775, partial [Pseudonocardiales bacterium]|nr:hypothetical protein [Pseudonocardiales bacterium]
EVGKVKNNGPDLITPVESPVVMRQQRLEI